MKLKLPTTPIRFPTTGYCPGRRAALKTLSAFVVPATVLALRDNNIRSEGAMDRAGSETVMVNGWVLLQADVNLFST